MQRRARIPAPLKSGNHLWTFASVDEAPDGTFSARRAAVVTVPEFLNEADVDVPAFIEEQIERRFDASR